MKYLIAGYGKFGRIALKRLRGTFPLPSIVVLDPKANLSDIVHLTNVVAVQTDAVKFLVEHDELDPDDMVIPMVPFHLAASYAKAKLSNVHDAPFPSQIMGVLPNPFRIDEHTLACSRADFLCPDDCAEGETCTVTGERRDRPLYDEIGSLQVGDFTTLVLHSVQVLPGVGGYLFSDLTLLLDQLRPGKYIVATSCKCHAILTGMRVTNGPIKT